MVSSVDLQIEDGIVWATVHGPITSKFGDQLLGDVIAFARTHDTWKFMFDLRRAGLVEGIVSLHQRIGKCEAAGMPARAPRAILCSHRTPDYDFLETTSVNRGHNLMVFTDGEQALKWLAAQRATPPGHGEAKAG